MAKKNSNKKVNKTKVETNQSKLSKELSELTKILTGEMELREKEELLEEKKKEAKKKKRQKLVDSIEKGDTKIEEDDTNPKVEVVQNIKLFEWEAPIRVQLAFDMKTFLIIVAASLVFIVYLAILQQYYLMLAIIAILFVIYAAGTTQPEVVTHRITARGIDTFGQLFEWFMLDEFWFSKKNDEEILIVDTKLRYPSRLLLLIKPEDREAIFVLLQENLLYKDIRKQGRLEKSSYGEYIPLDEI